MVKSQSPLLNHLITAEKNAQAAFTSYTSACEAANNALNGWAAADTGDSPDVMTVSNRVCELFDYAFEAQKTYLIGLGNYRSSLKDVAAREAEIRVILRDRDIFVSRLVKLNNKKLPNSDSAYEAHTAKLEEARAELAACESTLKSEERALVGVKRRIFREALRMRMRAMGQLADVWRDTADRSVQILDALEFDNGGTELRPGQQAQAPPPTQMAPSTPSHNRHSRILDSVTSPEGSVIAPSHSASQVARRAAGYPDDYSDDEDVPPVPGVPARHLQDGSGGRATGEHRKSISSQQQQPKQESIAEEEEEAGSSADERGKDNSTKYQVHVNKPLSPAELAARKQQQQQQGSVDSQQQPVAQAQPAHIITNSALPNGTAGQQARKRLSSVPSPTTPTQTNQAPASAQPATSTGQSTTQPASAPQQQSQQPQGILRNASPGPVRETADERAKRFSTLGASPSADPMPTLALPNSNQFTVAAHTKRNAPEASMFLPSSSANTKSYRATNDSDDEGQDQVRELASNSARRRTVSGPAASSSHRRQNSFDSASIASSTNDASTARGGSRKLHTSRTPSGRHSYAGGRGSEFGDTSTVAGGDRTPGKKSKHEKEKSGGFFGAVAGLFKSRDLQTRKEQRISRRSGGGSDDDTPPGSPRHNRDAWNTVGRDGVSSSAKKSSGGGGSLFGGSKKKRVSTVQAHDSDSDAPDPRSLVRVVNNGGRRPMSEIGFSSRTSAVDLSGPIQTYNPPPSALKRSTSTATTKRDSNVWVPPHARPARKAMSDVGETRPKPASAVKRKSTVKSTTSTTPAPISTLDRKSSVRSTATAATDVAKPKKKKVRPASTIEYPQSATPPMTTGTGPAGPGPRPLAGKNISYDASGWVSTAAKQAGVTMEIYGPTATAGGSGRASPALQQQPQQQSKVTRDTPSLMSVVAPAPASRQNSMHLPSAKNPYLSASATMPNLGNSGSRPSSPDPVTAGEPVKRKKTVKKASAASSGATTPTGTGPTAPISAMKQSATTPSLSVNSNNNRPASILSNGSEVGSALTARRKSVRLASDTNVKEASYSNVGAPATFPSQQPPVASTSTIPNGDGQQQQQGYSGEWSTRTGRDGDISSDEEGDEYAKIRAQLNRADRGWEGAGFSPKGKGRAV